MPEQHSEFKKSPVKLRVGSIHADARYLEDPIHALIGHGEKITIAPGTRILRVDFMPGGKRNPPRTTDVIETSHGPRTIARVDLAEATQRLRELSADMPKFARILQRDGDLQTIPWVVGEANGPMARIALKRMGFIPATTREPQSPKEYEEIQNAGRRSITVVISMENFLRIEETLEESIQALQKRKNALQQRMQTNKE